MPSRVRVILQHVNGTTYAGKRAVMQMWHYTSAARKTALKKLPSRLVRLKALVQDLPPEWTLTLVREKRGTTRRKSLYWSLLNQRPAVQPGDNLVAELVQMQAVRAAHAQAGQHRVNPPVQQAGPVNPVRRRAIEFEEQDF